MKFIFFLIIITFIGTPARADSYPNWESCGLGFWGDAKDFTDYRNGVPVAKLGQNAATIADAIDKEGVFYAATLIQVVYARCVEKFAKGNWTNPSSKPQYQGCAYRSTIMLAILLRLKNGDPQSSVKLAIPVNFHDLVEVISRNYQDSPEKAAVMVLNGIKDCVAEARKIDG